VAEIGNVLRIVQHFSQSGNEALLVSYWQVASLFVGVPSMTQVAEAYHAQFTDTQVPAFLHGSATYERTVVDNVSDGLEFGELESPQPGIVAGDPAPSFNAIGVKQAVTTRLTRGGSKRLPFISESNMNGNNPALSGASTLAIELWWGDPLLLLNVLDDEEMILLNPVVVGRTLGLVTPDVYDLDLSKINLVSSAVVTNITSQNSRKA